MIEVFCVAITILRIKNKKQIQLRLQKINETCNESNLYRLLHYYRYTKSNVKINDNEKEKKKKRKARDRSKDYDIKINYSYHRQNNRNELIKIVVIYDNFRKSN